MALPSNRDQDLTRAVLARWLSEHLEGADDVRVSEIGGPPATGFSNETLLFDASWNAAGVERTNGFAVRVQPTSHTVFPADTLAVQARTMRVLGEHTKVPVPTVRWFEDDPDVLGAPFLVMDRCAGKAPADQPPYTVDGWLKSASEEEQRLVWRNGLDAMADVHLVDWAGLGLADLDPCPDGGSRLAHRLDWWARFLEWAGDGVPQPVPEAALAWLQASLPAEGAPSLCWGDSRIGNQLFVEGQVTAILDWEMLHIGDPVQDLAWFLYLDRHMSEGVGVPRLPGFDGPDRTVARWEQRTGRTVVNLDWHQVFAGLAFAAVMVRLAHLLVLAGLIPAELDFAHTNTGVTFLAAELDRLGAR